MAYYEALGGAKKTYTLKAAVSYTQSPRPSGGGYYTTSTSATAYLYDSNSKLLASTSCSTSANVADSTVSKSNSSTKSLSI